MATATQQYIKNDDRNEMGAVYSGHWLTAASAGGHTIKFPGKVAYFKCLLDWAGTSPIQLEKWADQVVDETIVSVLTAQTIGSTGVITSEADSGLGITVAHLPNGTSTVLVGVTNQVNDGVNYWIAYCYK